MTIFPVALKELYRTVMRLARAVVFGPSCADIVRRTERKLRLPGPGHELAQEQLLGQMMRATACLPSLMEDMRVACYQARGHHAPHCQALKEVERRVRILGFGARDLTDIIGRLGFFDVSAAALSEANLNLDLYSFKVRSFVRAEQLAERARSIVDDFERLGADRFIALELQRR